MNRLKNIFRGFKYRNFRLFFPSLAITQIGVWIQNVAISWLVYDITKSAFTMGSLTFISTAPLFVLSPFMGAIADKYNRHKLLIFVQSLYILQTFLMTIVAFSGLLNLYLIVALGVFINAVASLDAPLRQSSFVLLVDDPKDLGNAISLNASCFNLARFIGPSIAGVIIGYFGAKYCFLLNFLVLVPTFFLIKAMKIKDIKNETVQKENIFHSVKDGFLYSIKNSPIITAQIYLFLFSLLVMSYPMLLPIYTADVLVSKANILGYLLGATGVGSLTASLIIASKMSITGLRRILFIGCIFVSSAFVFTGFNSNAYFVLCAMFFLGVASTFFITPQNVLVQTAVEDAKRGRIISLNALCFLGTYSLSCFFTGAVAQKIGISNTFIVLGIAVFVVSCFFSYKISKFDYTKKIS